MMLCKKSITVNGYTYHCTLMEDEHGKMPKTGSTIHEAGCGNGEYAVKWVDQLSDTPED